MSNAGTDQTPDFPDWKGDFENSVQKEKEAYIREHRLTVWRDHDHMHTHQPDSIFTGVIKYLGWESYFNTEISGMMPFFYVFDIPECTVSELGEELKVYVKNIEIIEFLEKGTIKLLQYIDSKNISLYSDIKECFKNVNNNEILFCVGSFYLAGKIIKYIE